MRVEQDVVELVHVLPYSGEHVVQCMRCNKSFRWGQIAEEFNKELDFEFCREHGLKHTYKYCSGDEE